MDCGKKINTRFLIRVIIGLVLIALAGPSAYSLTLEEELQKLKQAEIPTTIEELNLPEIPDEENGTLIYREAFKLMDSLREKYKKEWDCIDGYDRIQGIAIHWDEIPTEEKKKVANLILYNPDFAKFYQLLEKASQMRCKFFKSDDYRKMTQEEPVQMSHISQPLSHLRACARTLAKKVKIEAENREINKALSTSLTGLKIAKSLSNEPIIITQLTRIAMEVFALNRLEEIIDKGDGNIELYQSLINETEKERKNNLINFGLKGEIIIFRLYLSSHYRKVGKEVFEFTEEDRERIEEMFFKEEDRKRMEENTRKWKGALKEAYLKSGYKDTNTFFDEQESFYLDVMSKFIPLTEQPYWVVKDELEKIEQEVKAATTEKAIMTQLYGPPQAFLYTSEARLDALLGATELGLANKIYRAKHGRFADSLSQLTPEILPSLPLDPFTGKDYIYKKKGKGFIVYSVGEDLKDDEGVEEKGLKPDIVWEDKGENPSSKKKEKGIKDSLLD